MQRLLEACAFAARLHAGARQKGHEGHPYINHVIDVALRASLSGAADETLVTAALLHDTVEKAGATPEQIAALFGQDVARLVAEVTDPSESDSLSPAACRLRLADKAANLAALTSSPPGEWDREALAAYLHEAERVAASCRAVDPVLSRGFDEAAETARAALARSQPRP
ncbi:HD domain-containing protein [Cereibacter sphaeroides]|uniref:HD domain-containing protein n=1 Tax=Cereibacter sphaeroides TaxID=1063 RepID=UPI001F48B90E|nr:HD domain-containing protein [Cereibacter sphaeroides]MCE6959040.1 HD domain-containing protein [Cereibacter sphaeroides]MCE6969104.1 HD domain-containing protein [Cereibacter sphaeroides]MCE6973618.1 HD domain-containing protein [Cereibacter sphaeroides]